MDQKPNLKGVLMAITLMEEIERARRGPMLGPAGVLVRAALVVVFMYLVVIAYSLMGVSGSIYISLLFLAALLLPFLIQKAGRHLRRRPSPLGGRVHAGPDRREVVDEAEVGHEYRRSQRERKQPK